VNKIAIIIALLIIIYSLTLIEAPLKEINETSIGDYVRVQGTIQSYAGLERLTIFNLIDETGSIKVVFFKQAPAWNGKKVEVTGRVAEYKGELELKGVRLKYLN